MAKQHGSEYFPQEAGPPRREFGPAFEGLKRTTQRGLNRQGVKPRLYARDEDPRTARKSKRKK
jgi:hypothetical protein